MKYGLEVLREHRPPPNASAIELWQFFPDPNRDPSGTDSRIRKVMRIINNQLYLHCRTNQAEASVEALERCIDAISYLTAH